MIRIELDEATLSRTRIAISPLWETICSILLLNRTGPAALGFPYDRWEVRARAAMAAEPAAAAAQAYLVRPLRIPDFLSPVPAGSTPTIEEELACLRATPRQVIEADLRQYPEDPTMRDFLTPGALDRFADGLATYWARAIEPFWPAMHTALEEEVLNRARALAAEGPGDLLAGLHERVRWTNPVLSLVKTTDVRIRVTDKRLLLIPLIFSRGALMCTTDHPEVVAVSYQARGSAVLAREGHNGRDDAARTDGLALLLGSGRAGILRALSAPSTTAGLAARLGLAPSTVSEHLSVLVNAGVANRRRVGRRVLYGLEPAGRAMVCLIAPQHSAGAEFFSWRTD